MSTRFDPSGILNISADPADLPQVGEGYSFASNALTRCKNLRINQRGQAITRDGSAKINSSAINTAIWWIEEMDGSLYEFAGDTIYQDESSLASSLTSAQWSAIQYNAYNDTTNQIFALNGTDRKRITSGAVNNWGIAAPTDAPVLGVGAGAGLTGTYNVRYTYVRKVGTSIVAESNPSVIAAIAQELSDQSLTVDIGTPSDSQVTHARLYRTLNGGSIYYLDTEIAISTAYAYGYTQDWEESEGYIAGTGWKFTTADSTHSTENTYSWEYAFETLELEEPPISTEPPDFDPDDPDIYDQWWKFPEYEYPP